MLQSPESVFASYSCQRCPQSNQGVETGDQFRVGLAIALAIHWRATGRSAGTVIVDEGFGALDNEGRLAVAEQIADVGEGLLRHNSVGQIIVGTHASEVQNCFPYRWEIEKKDGQAVVELEPGQDSRRWKNIKEASALNITCKSHNPNCDKSPYLEKR